VVVVAAGGGSGGGGGALPALVVPAALGLHFADAARVDLDVVEPHLRLPVHAVVVHHGVGERALLLALALAVYSLVEELARLAQHAFRARRLVERLRLVQPVLRTCQINTGSKLNRLEIC